MPLIQQVPRSDPVSESSVVSPQRLLTLVAGVTSLLFTRRGCVLRERVTVPLSTAQVENSENIGGEVGFCGIHEFKCVIGTSQPTAEPKQVCMASDGTAQGNSAAFPQDEVASPAPGPWDGNPAAGALSGTVHQRHGGERRLTVPAPPSFPSSFSRSGEAGWFI